MKYVDFNGVCTYLGVRICSYEAGAEFIREAHLEQLICGNPWIFCACGGMAIILFDSTLPAWAIRLHTTTALSCFALGYLGEQRTEGLKAHEKFKAYLFAIWLLLQFSKNNRRFDLDAFKAEIERQMSKRKKQDALPSLARR